MIIPLRSWIRWSKFIFLLVVCTWLLYQLISWIVPWFYPDPWGRQTPGNGAIKVFASMDQPLNAHVSLMEQVKHRLMVFYWLNE